MSEPGHPGRAAPSPSAAPLEVSTAAFGPVEHVTVPAEAVWTFADGVPGFEGHTRFALIDDARIEPFHWLQSLDDAHTGFLVIEPATFTSGYEFDLSDEDVALLGFDGTIQPRVLCVLVVPDDVRSMTANLRAPLVVNPERRVGKQVILSDERFPLRHPVFASSPGDDERRSAC